LGDGSGDGGVGDGEGGVEGGDGEVDLVLFDDEGRGDDEVADPGLDGDAAFEHVGGDLIDDGGFAVDLVLLGVEGLFGGLVADEFDGPEEAEAADVADAGMFGFEGVEFFAEIEAHGAGAFDEVEALHLVDGGDGGGEGHGVGFVGVAVGEEVVFEEVGDFGGGGAEAEGDVGGGDAFGGDEDVGLDVPVVDGEPFAGAAPAGHDFVGDEEDVAAVADFAEAREVFGWWDEDAVGADDGFDEDGGYVVLVFDHVFEIVGAGDVAGGVGVFDGAVVAVGFGGEEEALAFATGFHGPAAGVAGGGDGGHGGAVVRAIAGDDFCLAGVHAGDFEGGFVGVGAGGGEEEFDEAFGEDVEEETAELDAGVGGVGGGDVGEGAGLLGDGFDDGGIFVAEVDAHELGGEIEVALAVAVGEVAAFSVDDVHGVPGFLIAPGAVVKATGPLADFLRGEGGWVGECCGGDGVAHEIT
jgi:hypothetical protein